VKLKNIARKTTLVIFVSLTLSSLPSLATPPENASGYWNEATMKAAKPRYLLMDPKSGIAQLTEAAPNLSTSEIGADWLNEGLPQAAVGKVFFSIGRNNYVCSGSVLEDGLENSRAVVVTAGHCVIDRGKFVTNFMFVPNFDEDFEDEIIPNSNRYYAKNLVVKKEFASQRQFNVTAIQHDWAFAVIPTGSFTKNKKLFTNPAIELDSTAGAFAYSEEGFSLTGDTSTAFGYPQALPFTGERLIYARGGIFPDPNGYGTWGMNSILTGGASGGPWLSLLNTDNFNSGSVSSVNSYKYTNDSSRMYGPRFNTKTTQTRNAANNVAPASTADVIVP